MSQPNRTPSDVGHGLLDAGPIARVKQLDPGQCHDLPSHPRRSAETLRNIVLICFGRRPSVQQVEFQTSTGG